jgi:nucleoside-diphosphate-sugar epimerase
VVAVVTGAAGFIGRVLVEVLAVRGPVVAIDRRPPDRGPGVTGLVADLLDHDRAVRAALARASVVYHLAGCPDVRDPRPDAEQRRYRDNVLATASVLAAVPPDVPLVVTSSSSVYGGATDRRPSAETDPLRPRGGYARSKLLVERLCEGRLQAGGGQVCVVRPFTVAGEGQRPGMAIAQWITAARAGQPLRLFGDPERTRDITDVRDVVRALTDLADGRTCGVVNIGTGVGHTLRELAAAVCGAFGAPLRTVLHQPHPAEATHTLADTTRLRRLLGWVPRTDLAALIARQIAASDTSEPAVRPHTA